MPWYNNVEKDIIKIKGHYRMTFIPYDCKIP